MILDRVTITLLFRLSVDECGLHILCAKIVGLDGKVIRMGEILREPFNTNCDIISDNARKNEQKRTDWNSSKNHINKIFYR